VRKRSLFIIPAALFFVTAQLTLSQTPPAQKIKDTEAVSTEADSSAVDKAQADSSAADSSETAVSAPDSTESDSAAVEKSKKSLPSDGPEAMRLALIDLKSELQDNYQKYSHQSQNTFELYMSTLARIDVALQYLLKNYKLKGDTTKLKESFGFSKSREKRANYMFDACSKLAEVTIIHLEKDETDAQQLEIADIRDSIFRELGKIYESIIDDERGRAAKLREELLKEYEKSKKLMDDAKERFNKLQSKLIKVRKDARGTIISMSDLLFGFDKANLTEDLKTNLAKIAGILTIYKTCRVIVEGHTDNKGTAKYNKNLSRKRAKNVKDFLVAQGIDVKRLTSVGYGFRRPIASNRTKEGRQKNRRVDLVIIDKKMR
jgi:outer membrane protein OmpA-like peptidoglycan-associated protein